MTQSPDCRGSIVDALGLLSSPDRQLAYERNVPHVRVTDELVSVWFDDAYLPESRLFKQCFSAEEMGALAAFNTFYDERLESLPGAVRVADWLNNRDWRQIMAQAAETLALLNG
jgi:hypothetical protein